jgi:hypothetical protein
VALMRKNLLALGIDESCFSRTPRMSREQTAELVASRATEGSELDALVGRHFRTLKLLILKPSSLSEISSFSA